MFHGYVLFAIFIIFVTYNAIWAGDCSLRCLLPRDDISAVPGQHCSQAEPLVRTQGEPQACICEACPCSLIENYVIPATRECIRQADSVFQYLADHPDILQQFYGWISQNTSSRRLAQPVDETRTSLYSDSVGEFKIVDNPYYAKNQLANGVDKNDQQNVEPSVSGVTKIGTEVVEKIKDVAGEQPTHENVQPETLVDPLRIRSVLTADSSDPPKTVVVEEPVEPASNCSKCVEKGKTCIRGCPNAEKKQRKLKK